MVRSVFCATTAALLLAGCWNHVGEEYVQRLDTITSSAGNAKDINANQHIINPWPSYVGNRNIPGSGAKMARAVKCNEQRSGEPIAPLYDTSKKGGQVQAAGGGGVGGVSVQVNTGQAQGSQGKQQSVEC